MAGLYGDEDSDGAAALLTRAERALARLGRFDDSLEALHARVADLMYQVQDVAEELRDRRADFAYSGEELESIESRLDVIHRLRRKYGASCQDILDYLAKAQKELDEIEFADDEIARLKAKLQGAEQNRLGSCRSPAAGPPSRGRAADCPDTGGTPAAGYARVQFQCQFARTELGPMGADAVAFYMSANVGEALKPMNKAFRRRAGPDYAGAEKRLGPAGPGGHADF